MMAKDFQKTCPDCDGPDLGSLYIKGDGNCNECHGTGVDEVSSVFNSLVNADKDKCKVCSGTGQCQTCGGTGYVFYDVEVNDDSTEYISPSSNYGSSTGYGSSSYSDYSTEPAPSSSTSSGDSYLSSIWGFIFLGVMGMIIFNQYNSCQSRQVTFSKTKESVQVVSPPVEIKPHFNQNLLDGKWVKKAGLGGNRNEDGLIISFKNDEGTAIYVPQSAHILEGQVIWKNFNAEKNWVEVYVNLSGGYLNSSIQFIDSKTIKINFDTFKRK